MARSVAKKAASAVKKAVGAAKKVARKTAKAATKAVGAAKKAASKKGAAKKPAAKKAAKKAAGDVIGVSRARVPAGTPRATTDRGGNPKGIEIGPQAKGPALLKRSRARF